MTTRPDQPAETPSQPKFDAVAESKALLRAIRAGALATVAADGSPFSSLVTVATAHNGDPILLMSRLASHTRHLEADDRLSLLLAQTGKGDPLAHPRLTLLGSARRDSDPVLRARFLARHPKAELYADFPDFSFWRVALSRAHINGGFARAAELSAADLSTSIDGAEALIAAEEGALAHLNADHADALALYARVIAREPAGQTKWKVSGLDPEGLDLMAGERTARIPFPRRVVTPGDLRRELVALADAARAAPQAGGHEAKP